MYTSPLSRFEFPTSVVIGIDCIGSCKSNYHTTTATISNEICLIPFVLRVQIRRGCLEKPESRYKITTVQYKVLVPGQNLHFQRHNYVVVLFICFVISGERWLFVLLKLVEQLTIIVLIFLFIKINRIIISNRFKIPMKTYLEHVVSLNDQDSLSHQ